MTTNDYTKTSKNDLIALALSRGLVRTKTAARDMKADALRALLAAADTFNVAEDARVEAEIAALVGAPRFVHPGSPEAHKTDAGFEPSLPENAGAHAAPVVLDAPAKKPRVRLTAEQRANKLARNRRRHKRHLARTRHGWANAQRTIREGLAEYEAAQ